MVGHWPLETSQFLPNSQNHHWCQAADKCVLKTRPWTNHISTTTLNHGKCKPSHVPLIHCPRHKKKPQFHGQKCWAEQCRPTPHHTHHTHPMHFGTVSGHKKMLGLFLDTKNGWQGQVTGSPKVFGMKAGRNCSRLVQNDSKAIQMLQLG